MLPTSSRRHEGNRPWMMKEDMISASSATAEFIGTMLLQIFAGSTSSPMRIAAVFAALMATFARHSGGHLNPAISLAAALSGHMGWGSAGMYILAQVLGAIAGAAVQVIITPSLAFFQPYDPSCHQPMTGLGGTPLYFWETLAAFVFVYVAYPALFARPNYGSIGPLFVGLALFGVLSTGGPFTGFSPLNPALTFAGSLIFDCVWRYMWMYLLAQFTGAGLAALLAVGVYGVGPMYMTEAERSDYMALSGGPETGLSGGAGGVLTGQQAGAPAGSPGTTMSTGTF